MMYYIIKVTFSADLIMLISEAAKKTPVVAILLASVPFVLAFSMIWLYIETKDISRISEFFNGIFWLAIPSAALFAALPILLKMNVNFYVAIGLAIALTVMCYLVMLTLLKQSLFE